MGFSETLKALNDPVRRDILMMLRAGRMSAGSIGAHFSLTGASVSYHLSILKKADLVRESRRGNFIDYELNTSVLEEVMLWLSKLRGEENHDEQYDEEQGAAGADQRDHPAADAGGAAAVGALAADDGDAL